MCLVKRCVPLEEKRNMVQQNESSNYWMAGVRCCNYRARQPHSEKFLLMPRKIFQSKFTVRYSIVVVLLWLCKKLQKAWQLLNSVRFGAFCSYESHHREIMLSGSRISDTALMNGDSQEMHFLPKLHYTTWWNQPFSFVFSVSTIYAGRNIFH